MEVKSSKLIDSISLPGGLRSLSVEELAQTSEELRDELIDAISEVGGHFASSLGAADITVALHHCFDTPNDKIVWDVGHQAYIHKMLTGRREKLPSIRRLGGISGFLKRSESEFDTFGAGHAGTSISAAVGMKVEMRIKFDSYDPPNNSNKIYDDTSDRASVLDRKTCISLNVSADYAAINFTI